MPVDIPQLYDALSLAPTFALGFSDANETTARLNRTTSAVTTFPTLYLLRTRNEALASDGAFVAGQSSPASGTKYVSPAGAISDLSTTGVVGHTAAHAINDSHMIIGDGGQGGLLWPTPTSDPVILNNLPGIPSSQPIASADYIGNRGDIAGTMDPGTGSNDDVFVLSVGTSLTASIALTNADGSPFTGAGAKIGDMLKATVTLQNTSQNRPVTGLTVDPALVVSPSGSLTLTDGPTPAVPSSLAPGASASYVMTYTISAKGTATLSVTANGTQNSLAASATASVLAHLGQPISVSVTFEQNGMAIPNNTVKLADTDTGEVPQDLTAVVTLKNITTVQQDNVHFNGNPVPSFHTASQALPKVPLSVTSGPTGDVLSSLAPGQTATVRYVLHVSNNGVFDVAVQVLSGDAGGTRTLVSPGLGTLTANPTALLSLTLHPVTDVSGLVTPGSPVLVSGTLVNRSQTQTLDLIPVEPKITGGDNAGSGALTDSSVSDLPDGVRLPLAGKIAPATTVNVEAELDTAPVAGTRATVTYDPSGFVVQSDGTETKLLPEQIRVSAGSSPVQIHLNTRDPEDVSTASSIAGSFAKAAFIGASEWYLSGLKAGAALLAHPFTSAVHFGRGVAGFVVGTATAAKQAAGLLGALYLLTVYYDALTPEERGNFANQIVADYEASSINTAHQALQNAADPILLKFQNALQTGNYNQVAEMAGTGLATGAGLVADTLLTDIAFQKLGLLAKGRGAAVAESQAATKISLADAIEQAKVTGKAGAAIKGIVKGQNLLLKGAAALIDSYGLTPTQVRLLRDFCEHNGITVALRSRSKQAAELIKKGIAIGKNLVIKLKNVDEIDVAFLGYSRADLNTVVWAEPISRAELLRNIERYPGITPELRDLAEARYAQRAKEWANETYHAKINKWSKQKEIELMFDGAGSGVPELDAGRTLYRRFALEQVKTEKRYYKRFMVGNKAGKTARLVKVTQDVDLVAILGGDGSILAAKIRAKAYEYLENILGIQHPDTIPWVMEGEVAFEAKTRLLIDHLEGGEALAVFGADGGVRAGFFNPVLTVFDKATKGGYVFLEGAYNNPYARAAVGALGKLLG